MLPAKRTDERRVREMHVMNTKVIVFDIISISYWYFLQSFISSYVGLMFSNFIPCFVHGDIFIGW